MADKSAIEWTDATWNPVTGCSKVSPGCAHCYAETLSLRFKLSVGPWTPANAAENVVLHPDRLDQPLRWTRPRMVFVNSMSDLFHEEISDDFIARVFDVMARAPQHVFQVLTKRPERMRDLLLGWQRHEDASPELLPLPNVWLGVSIENRRFVHRADLLRETPAAVRFISAEPLLGPLVRGQEACEACGEEPCMLPGCTWGRWPYASDDYEGPQLDLTGIDWLVVGGESGPGHRPMQVEWVRDLRDVCLAQAPDYPSAVEVHMQPMLAERRERGLRLEAERTAFFFKQWGGTRPKSGGRELDGRTWDEFPRAREQVTLPKRSLRAPRPKPLKMDAEEGCSR